MPKPGHCRFKCLDCEATMYFSFLGHTRKRKTNLDHCVECGSTCLEMDSSGCTIHRNAAIDFTDARHSAKRVVFGSSRGTRKRTTMGRK